MRRRPRGARRLSVRRADRPHCGRRASPRAPLRRGARGYAGAIRRARVVLGAPTEFDRNLLNLTFHTVCLNFATRTKMSLASVSGTGSSNPSPSSGESVSHTDQAAAGREYYDHETSPFDRYGIPVGNKGPMRSREGPTVRIRLPPAESPRLPGFRCPTARSARDLRNAARRRWLAGRSAVFCTRYRRCEVGSLPQ
jgi:hypothetical protein